MIFNSGAFAVFLAVVYSLYLLTLRRHRLQNALLLLASYVFYGWWDWRFLGLLAGTTLVDYLAGLALDRPDARRRRAVLVLSIATNLGVLGFFKYFNFFADSLGNLLAVLGVPASPRTLNIILPVGVSFYTFQSLSYTIDVYRGTLRAVRNPIDFALFVSFFPQLVAGPIVRAADFLPQVTRPRTLRAEQILEGAYLMLWGLFKKVVVADNLAPIVDAVFAAQAPTAPEIMLGVYAFAFQIYGDFSGYSDIARGCAKLMGFEFALNFNLPYFATNPSDFWRRWHISLSTWLRDYLYIPLGGNRSGRTRTCLNLMLTMTLGGLWHGAAWTFVLWGAFHGLWLSLNRLTSTTRPEGERSLPGTSVPGRVPSTLHPSARRADESRRPFCRTGFQRSNRYPLRRFVACCVTFHLVCFGWLLFRAESLAQVGGFLSSLLSVSGWFSVNTWTSGPVFADLPHTALKAACFIAPLLFVELLQRRRGHLDALLRLPHWLRGPAYACMLYGLLLLGSQAHRPFIYFQF